jgi:hypothetical protein
MCSTKTFLTQTEDILIEFVVKRHYAFFYRIAINDNATFRVIIAIVRKLFSVQQHVLLAECGGNSGHDSTNSFN